jgi:DNA processing protein
LIKQGAKLTATWEDVWEDLPSHVKRELEEQNEYAGGIESNERGAASLFNDTDASAMPDHERRVLEVLKREESTQLDELIEGLEAQVGSAEIFTALFELELRGRVKQLPGKNYVRCF